MEPHSATESDATPAGAPESGAPARSVRDVTSLLDAAAGPVPVLIVAWGVGLALVAVLAPHLTVLNVIGFIGAFIAGLVGVGGAVILTPLLLYAPPAFRMPPLGMHTVAAITMVQVAIAGTISVLVHRREGHVDSRLVKVLGSAVISGSFGGAALSGFVAEELLRGIFAMLAMLAVALLPLRFRAATGLHHGHLDRRKYVTILLGAVLGVLVGLVGAGGGFLLVPLMLYLLHVPLRTALGTSLAIVALSALAGAAGKILSGQVDFVLALALIAGALPGAQSGAATSYRVSPKALTLLLGVLVGAVALRMWIDLLL